MHARRGRGLTAMVSAGILTLIFVPGASAAKAPRLSGTFRTELKITYEKNLAGLKVGSSGTTTWTFAPRCRSGSCTTILDRPSILPGSTTVYVYALKPVSATRYGGSIKPVVVPCLNQNGSVRVAAGLTNYQTIVLNVTKAAGGNVTAFTGSQHTIAVPTALGKAHGCTSGEQHATFKG